MGGASALDGDEVPGYLIGSVDGEVEDRVLVEARQGYPRGYRQLLRLVGRRNPQDLEPLLHLLSYPLDRPGDGRARPQAQDHPVPHHIRRRHPGGPFFIGVRIRRSHQDNPPPNRPYRLRILYSSLVAGSIRRPRFSPS